VVNTDDSRANLPFVICNQLATSGKNRLKQMSSQLRSGDPYMFGNEVSTLKEVVSRQNAPILSVVGGGKDGDQVKFFFYERLEIPTDLEKNRPRFPVIG
jgi:hypothetical protein